MKLAKLTSLCFFWGFGLIPWVGVAGPVINEVQSTNLAVADPFGQFPDWVEVYNPDPVSADLSNCYLSDSTSSKLKFRFPTNTLLAPGEFLVVWAGSTSDFPNRNPYHATFGISSGGEPVVLTASDGVTVLDEYPSLAIPAGQSLGRKPDGTGPLHFFSSPTMGAANTTTGTIAETLPPPTFTVPGGIYTSNVVITISNPVAGGIVRYTLDGSDPSTNSPIYSNPILLGSRNGQTNVFSEIPTNPGGGYDESWQPPQEEVFKINVLRARVFKTNANPSRITTRSYLIDPAGISRYPYPIVSIATTPENLFSPETGIYVAGNYGNYYQDWERPGHIEFFETNGTPAFFGEVGLHLHGNTTVTRPRKSLRIYARNPAGLSTFSHQIFPEKNTASFDTFLLRNSGNDWSQLLFRDALVSRLIAHTGVDRMASRPAVVFLDGEYWGIHNLRDRIDEGYYYHHYGLAQTEFTQIEVASDNGSFPPLPDKGSTNLVSDFTDILQKASSEGFDSSAEYAAISDRIDIDNYIDYNIHEIWCGNTDWPGNNTRIWRSVSANRSLHAPSRHDGKWRWIIYDTDFGLGLNYDYVPGYWEGALHNTLEHATTVNGSLWANNPNATLLLRKLLENTNFRAAFINRFCDLLNTSLSATNAVAELEGMAALYSPGINEHVARWRTPVDWSNEVSRVRTYLQQRPEALRGHLQAKFGLAGTAQITVTPSNINQGVLAVNSLRLEAGQAGIGTNISNWTGVYFRGVPISLQATAKPGYRFSGWSRSVATPETVHAADMAASYTSWVQGSNLGSGFGPWWFWTNATNSGQAGHFLQGSRGGWGLYANSGYTSYAGRPLMESLVQGRVLVVRIKHGNVSSPGSVGVELRNNSWETIFKFERRSDSGVYWINNQPTTVVVTTAYLDLEITPVSVSGFIAKITPLGGASSSFSGSFDGVGTTDASDFLFYNFTAGSGGESDFFVTSLKVITPGSVLGANYTSYSTNPVLAENLAADAAYLASFEPVASDQWRLAYGLNLGGANLSNWQDDRDADGLTNLQEYFFGFSPLTGSAQINPLVPEAPVSGGSSFSMTYRKNKAATDIAGVVKWSSDLVSTNWNASGVVDTLVQDHGSYETRRATVPIQPGESKKFLRLEISGP